MELQEVEIRDWILLASAVIAVGGWFANDFFNRMHEIAKLRAEHRIDMLKSFISFSVEANHKRILDKKFNDIQVQFYLYGYEDEIESIKQVTDMIISNPNNPVWLDTLRELNILVTNKLRKELRLPKVKS